MDQGCIGDSVVLYIFVRDSSLTVVKTIAKLNGLFADFSAKPLEDQPGNGFHINISVKASDGTDTMNYLIAGILDKISDMTVFLNPTKNSYHRFGIHKAPRYISWSICQYLSGICLNNLCYFGWYSEQARIACSCRYESI